MYQNVNSKRIIAKDILISNDTWVKGINSNGLLVGPAGAGKTRGYVMRNILHAQDSLIVADTKGNLCGKFLEQRGYTVDRQNLGSHLQQCSDTMLNQQNFS